MNLATSSHRTWVLWGIVVLLICGGLLSFPRSPLGGVLLLVAALVIAPRGPLSAGLRVFSWFPTSSKATAALVAAAVGIVVIAIRASSSSLDSAPSSTGVTNGDRPAATVNARPAPKTVPTTVTSSDSETESAGRAPATLPARPTQPLFAQSTSVVAASPTTDGECDPSYPGVCIKPPPPLLTCRNIPYRRFAVRPPDPHGLDPDKDGVGCE
jgi:hypothetical protein